MRFKLEESWKKRLASEFAKDYMVKLEEFLSSQRAKGIEVYPNEADIFSAFNHTPFDEVKVVIIGQDPYHAKGQAHGLCFSVQPGVKIPPSLVNIFKELNTDIGMQTPDHGHLISWAKQGVLMLNNVLTVEQGKAGSHHKKGWEKFTDRVIEVLNEERENLVFLLWGNPAQKKGAKLNEEKHLILRSVHPSPLSSYRGFFGCKHFSQVNSFLKSKNLEEINWKSL